jgi:hypothetical protein
MSVSDREAIIREIAKKKVRYVLPNMDAVTVHRDLVYRDDLLMNIYCPPLRPGVRAPIVLIAFGYPDPQAGVRAFGPFTSWAQLIAASGMAAVIYGPKAPAEDIDAALAYVRANAERFDLDTERIALFAFSGHGPVGLSLLMRERLACAVVLCGYTMDANGSTAVADAAAEYGFADACHGRSADDLPTDVPLLFVRAGRDWGPGLNDALDVVIKGALARNLPMTVINHASGDHGFECDEDSDISREIIGNILRFLRARLIGQEPQ